MPLWKATISYDGTRLHGWQIQPKLPTVQGHLAAALKQITGRELLPQGSGRTDAGVHALGQVASFELDSPIPAASLQRALNRRLPSSIRVLSLEIVAPPFHARYSARSKTYEYRIFPRHGMTQTAPTHTRIAVPEDICPPTLAPFVWDCPFHLSLCCLESAARHILGTHDFTSFAASGSDALNSDRDPYTPTSPQTGYSPTPPTPARTIDQSAWTLTPAGLLLYRITGSGFLHHMVRNLVGTFVLCGNGRLAPSRIPAILAARSRAVAGPTAPARGLFLVEVHYP